MSRYGKNSESACKYRSMCKCCIHSMYTQLSLFSQGVGMMSVKFDIILYTALRACLC